MPSGASPDSFLSNCQVFTQYLQQWAGFSVGNSVIFNNLQNYPLFSFPWKFIAEAWCSAMRVCASQLSQWILNSFLPFPPPHPPLYVNTAVVSNQFSKLDFTFSLVPLPLSHFSFSFLETVSSFRNSGMPSTGTARPTTTVTARSTRGSST